jgi:sugar lactone lactonase YvrE
MCDRSLRVPDVYLLRLGLPLFQWPRRIHSAAEPRPEAAQQALTYRWLNRPWHGIHFLALICLLLWTATPAKAQPPYGYSMFYDGVYNPQFCGGDMYGFGGCLSPPASSSFSIPNGLAVDLSGNLYIADSGNNRILEVAAGATTATVFPISGLSSPSTLANPNQLAVDSAGNLYIADTGNNRIIEVSPPGSASVLSTGSYTLSAPQGVAVDPSGDIFISDTGNHRIIELPSGGSATALSPSGITLATTTPTGLAVDTYGNLYIVDVANSQVLEVNTSLAASTVSFSSGTSGTASNTLALPVSVTVANNGVIYIADPGAQRVAVIDPQGDNYDLLMGDLVAVCGTSCFNGIGAIATDSKGTIYLVNNSLGSDVMIFQQGSANFGHVTLGSGGTTLTLGFDLSPGFLGYSPVDTAISGVAISTAGAQTADFTITGDNCSSGEFGAIPCFVTVQFTPTAAGLRRGALVLSFFATEGSPYSYLASGNFTVPLFGIGDAPVAALSPGVASHLSTGTLTFPQAFEPFETAYDGAGNIYVTDGPNNRVLMVPKGGGNATVVTIPAISPSPAGLSNPSGLAIDGAGNLFIADSGNNRIVEVTAAGASLVISACSTAPIVWDLTSDEQESGFSTSPPSCANVEEMEAGARPYFFNNPQSLFIDGSGNLTVDDAGNHALVQLAPNSFWTSDNTLYFSNAFVLATGSVSPGTNSSFAVDTNEGLYISDETNNRIIHVDRFGKTSIVDFSSLSTGLTAPHSVALDPMGNLYVMDAGGTSGSQRIVQEINGGTSNVVTTLPYTGAVSLGGSPNGLAIDNFGNLLVADFGGTSGTGFLTQINVQQSSQAFPSTAVNASSSPQTTTVTNLGDLALLFSVNPSYTSNFSENTSDRNLCTSDTSLTVGISCDVSILFTPQSDGNLSTNITVTDNTQNTLGSTQQIAVSGTASGEVDITSTALTFSPTSSVYGQSVTMTATVTDTSNTGTVPTGTVVFTDALTSSVTQESLNSSGVATLSGSQIVGSHSILAAYGGVSGTFLGSHDTETLVVAQASSGTAVTLSGTTLTATVTAVAPGAGTPTGSVQFKSNGTNVGSPVSLTNGVAIMTVTPSSGAFTAVYSGDNNFTSSASGVLTETTTAVTFSPTSAVYGQTVTVTATVSSNNGIPTGTVTFTDLTTTTTLASNVNLSSGVATAIASTLGPVSHSIQAVYTPTGSFQSSNGSNTLTITQAGTGTVLGLSNGTLTATITAVAPGAGTPTGSVQFMNGSTNLGSPVALSGGTAMLTVTPTAPYSFTAVYSGDSNFTGSSSTAVTSTSIPTTTAVTASLTSSVYGQQLTFTATVASNSGTPTGTVSFTDLITDTTLASNVSLSSGVAMATASTLLAGMHNIKAVYAPAGNFLTSNGSKSVTINQAGTTTALTLSGGTLTATVTAVAPGAGTPTSQVHFLNNGTEIGNVTLSGGIATLAVTPTPPYSYTAVYVGDPDFSGSTSAAVTQTTIPTTTTVTASPSSTVYGQPLTFTATVASSSGTPTGTVTFTDQTTATTLASSVTLVAGAAAVTASTLVAGNHTIQAVYTPTGSFVTSNGSKTVTIGKATTSTALTSSNGIVTATITVTAPGSGNPTGTVQFFNGSALLGSAPLGQGTASFNTPPITGLIAVYSGDAHFNGSTSAPLGFTQPNLTLSGGPNPSSFGQTVTFTLTVASGGSGGSVQFSDGATALGTAPLNGGQASFSTSALAPGSHVIMATYRGASATMGQFVYGVASTVTLNANPTSTAFGQMVTLTAQLGPAPPQGIAGPTGQVVFRDSGVQVGSATVSAGAATLQLSTLAAGQHQLAAVYLGDKNWAAGQSETVAVTVAAAPTSTTLVPTMAAPNQVVLTASVAASSQGLGVPTGSVQFVDTGNSNAVVATATLFGGTATATFAGNAAAAVEGRPIAAVYAGNGNFSGSTSAPLPQMANAAWNSPGSFAPEEIASLYGITGLNGDTTGAAPLTNSLSGVTVTITDSTGAVLPALISGVYASASQINFLIPANTAAGLAVVTVTLPGGGTITNVVNIGSTAPGIFTANSTGQGVYAGQVVYVNASGSETVALSTGPVNLAGGEQVYLVLYGTGLRHASSVTATVNGVSVPVAYFGAQGASNGIDQVNVGPLPASLAGAGTATLVITADGLAANPVKFTIQ